MGTVSSLLFRVVERIIGALQPTLDRLIFEQGGDAGGSSDPQWLPLKFDYKLANCDTGFFDFLSRLTNGTFVQNDGELFSPNLATSPYGCKWECNTFATTRNTSSPAR